MARTIGYVLGGLMLLDGVKDALNPRAGFETYDKKLRQYFPESFDRIVKEFSRLPDEAIRYVAAWEIVLAGLVLWLASRARD